MSLSEGQGRSTALTFLMERAQRDLQFSKIFRVEFVASMGYAAATVYFLDRNDLTPQAAPILMLLALLFAALHMTKILLVIYLERQGGDAREFVGSEQLVTSRFYAYSRNPVYVLSIAQSFVWSLVLICLGAGGREQLIALTVAALLLYGHYRSIDRFIIPNEEAALACKHPEQFAAYCARVNRWLGRKA